MKRFLFVLLIAVPALAADPASDIVKYRQSVMKAMAAHMTSMSLVVKKQVSDRSQLAAHAMALRDLSGGLPNFFPRGTGSDKTKTAAKNEVWQRFPEFEAAFRETPARKQRARRGRETRRRESVRRAVRERRERVRGCHRTFRVKDSD